MAKAFVLSPEGATREVDFDQDGDTLAFAQEMVGGWIEGLVHPFDEQGVTGYINEEGKILRLPKNGRATTWCDGLMFEGDFVAGYVVFVGHDEMGETVGLTPDQLATLHATFPPLSGARAVEVLNERPADGVTITKYQSYSGSGYRFDVVYELADGTELGWSSRHRLLRDAKAALAALPAVPRHPTSVTFNAEGEPWGERVSFSLSPRVGSFSA